MNFLFSAKKTEVSDELKAYAIKKFEKLDRFFNKDADALIKFREERGRHIVEATVHNDKLCFRAEDSDSEPHAAIDSISDIIERQIRKNKTRLEKRLRTGAFEREVQPMSVPEDSFEVVRHKRFAVKPMSLEEAILQMNLLNHEFFVFRNVDNDSRIAVVYKRNNNGYGIIEDEV